jgi:hypothetical protein
MNQNKNIIYYQYLKVKKKIKLKLVLELGMIFKEFLHLICSIKNIKPLGLAPTIILKILISLSKKINSMEMGS